LEKKKSNFEKKQKRGNLKTKWKKNKKVKKKRGMHCG
jgi:hypothetical protein